MTTIIIPDLITKSTYFWKPGCNANQRRYNERQRQAELDIFCNQVMVALPGAVKLEAYYSESCKNVRKRLTITRLDTGNKTNMTWLKNTCAKNGINLIEE